MFGQSSAGLGSISGTVRDASGAVVPNVTVVIANEAKGVRRTLQSNEAGVFAAPALIPAPGYSVSADFQGFNRWEQKNLELQVGQNLNLNITLTVSGSAVQVEVAGVAPIVEDTKTDVSQVVNTTQIQELPINGRRVDSFVLLTPAVSNDGTYGLLTFRGSIAGNSFLTDGNDTTQSYYNENAGRTRIASQISQDAVQEFQVLSAAYTAEFGRATGGVVNTVTKSGGNDVHGTGYWFFRNQDFNARDRYAAFNPPESRHQAGGSLGGPIVKDRLFYFFNGEIMRRDFPMASSISRPGTITPNGAWIGCGAPATPEQCDAINSLLPRFFGQIPRTADQELGFGKIDWHPNDRNSVSASLNFLRYVAPNGIQTSAASTSGSALTSNGNATVRARYGRLAWTNIPTTSSVNELRFGWFKDRQADELNPQFEPPFGPAAVSVAGANIGSANYLPRINPSENRYQIVDNFSWTRGRHAMKFGFDYMNTEDYVFNLLNQNGSYTYGSVTAFAQDFSGNGAGLKHYQTYTQAFGNAVVDFKTNDIAFYAQDQWRVAKGLTFNYGLRYEHTFLPQPSVANPDYPQTGRIPGFNGGIAPRAGIAWSPDDQKTVIRAGYGIYHARYPGGLIQTFFTATSVWQTSLTVRPTDAVAPVFPNTLPPTTVQPGTPAKGADITFAAPDLRTPYTQHGDVAIERQLRKDLALTVSYIWSRGLHFFTVRDLNIGPVGPDVTYTIQDAGGNTVGAYTTPTYLAANRIDPRYRRINMVDNGANSYYNGLAVQLNKRWSHGFQASFAYTWSHAIDDNLASANSSSSVFYSSGPISLFNGDYRAEKGNSVVDQRHRGVITFVWQPAFVHAPSNAFTKYVINGWQLSTLTTLASGRPSYASVQVSGSGGAFPGAAFPSTLNGFGGDTRVPFWPLNPLLTERTARADVRLSKIIPIGESVKVYGNFEVFNLTNTQSDTSVNAPAYMARNMVLTPIAGTGTGYASAGFPDGTNARRAQVSLRVVF
jgi:outer membrane receptor protein involved in Fe transport